MTAALREALEEAVRAYGKDIGDSTQGPIIQAHAPYLADALVAALSAQVPEDELIERCAKALCDVVGFKVVTPLERKIARAVLEAADRIEVLSSGQGRMGE